MNLEIRNLTLFNDQEDLIKDFSYSFAPGFVYFVFGQIGLGKSLLLESIADLYSRYQGKIIKDPKARISFLFQKNMLIPWLTVQENLALIDQIQNTEWVQTLQDELKISNLLNKKAVDLSGGELQKINFYRALAIEPNYILADEPFNSLDFKQKTELENLIIRYVKQRNATLIWVSHDLIEINKFSDFVLCFSKSEKRFLKTLAKDEVNYQTLSDYIVNEK